MQPDTNNDLLSWLMDNFNFRYLGLGIAGGTVGMLSRRKKNALENFFMVLTGTICAGVFTDPIHAYWHLKQPSIADLTGMRDALAVLVAALGWSIIRIIVIDGPKLGRRWLANQADFIINETKNSKEHE